MFLNTVGRRLFYHGYVICNYSSHKLFGEVTNHVINFKSPISLFQGLKMCCIIQLSAGLKCLSQLSYTAHFVDLKQKKLYFEIGDLVSDLFL